MAIDKRGKTGAFYGDLILDAMDYNIVRISSQLNSLDYQDYIRFHEAIQTILALVEIIEKIKVKTNQWP